MPSGSIWTISVASLVATKASSASSANWGARAVILTALGESSRPPGPRSSQRRVSPLNLDAAYTYDTEGKMTSVNYPTTYSWNGSQLVANTGPTYTYSFDAMSRPTGLTDQSNNTAVSNVSYNRANQLLSMNYCGFSRNRSPVLL